MIPPEANGASHNALPSISHLMIWECIEFRMYLGAVVMIFAPYGGPVTPETSLAAPVWKRRCRGTSR